MEGTTMGGDWSYHPNPPTMRNPVALKFSKPIRMLDSFTQNVSTKAYLWNSFFVCYYD